MTVVDTYTIQIVRNNGTPGDPSWWSVGPHLIAEAEENLTDLLPDGYRAVIRRWDQGDEDE